MFKKLKQVIEIKLSKLKKSLPKETHEITSWSDTVEEYTAICRLAAKNDDVFKTFKRSQEYRRVLEHVTEELGRQYLDVIQNEGKDLLAYFPRFKQNDSLGSPFKFNYGKDSFSSTTLRYIKVLMDLRNIFGNLDYFNIIEIGGGYGGQCKIISDVVNFRSYAIVDLDIVLPLIKKYLGKLNVKNFVAIAQRQIAENKKYDLAISNYAFAECSKVVQDEYIGKIINNSKRGYITYNDDDRNPIPHYNKSEIVNLLSKTHVIQVIKEKPKTIPNSFIITWDDAGR